MKKIVSLGAAMAAVALLSNAGHATSVSKPVDVRAVVSESAYSLSTRVLDRGTGAEVNAGAGPVGFGTPSNAVSEWSTLADHVVELKVENANNWELKTYTDNFNGTSINDAFIKKWGYQYGGMVDEGKVGKKVGMGWTVREIITSPITTGNPADGRKPLDPDLPYSEDNWQAGGNGFTYLKDKSDQNTPEPDGIEAPDGSTDQSFQYTSGYINVAYGGFQTTKLVRPELQKAVLELKGADAKKPFFYFLEGNFSGASAATYVTVIYFDLVNL